MAKIADLGRLKKALIQLIEKLDGLPDNRRKSLIETLAHKDTKIPAKNTTEEVSTFIALVFCTGQTPKLNDENRTLLENFSRGYLQPAAAKNNPSHSRKK